MGRYLNGKRHWALVPFEKGSHQNGNKNTGAVIVCRSYRPVTSLGRSRVHYMNECSQVRKYSCSECIVTLTTLNPLKPVNLRSTPILCLMQSRWRQQYHADKQHPETVDPIILHSISTFCQIRADAFRYRMPWTMHPCPCPTTLAGCLEVEMTTMNRHLPLIKTAEPLTPSHHPHPHHRHQLYPRAAPRAPQQHAYQSSSAATPP